MWKDFFYFSKSERRAILFLLTLLFIFMCIWVLFPVKEESLEQDQEGIEEIKTFWPEYMRWRRRNLCDIPMISLKEERWYWLLLIQIQPIPSNFCNVDCLLLLHILFCNTGEPAVNSGQRMISLVFMACRPRNLIC